MFQEGGRKIGKDNEVEHLELVSATGKAAMEGHIIMDSGVHLWGLLG